MLRKMPTRAEMWKLSLMLRFLPQFIQKYYLYGPGISRPNTEIPHLLLLRPYRSERSYFFSSAWCAAVVHQFGQPIMPTEVGSAFWKRSPGFKLPGSAAWKRSLWGFDRVFTADAWLAEVSDIAATSRIIIVDISELTPSILAEFEIIEKVKKSDNLICIYNLENLSDRNQYIDLFDHMDRPAILQAMRSSISYSFNDSDKLLDFWTDLAARCSSILKIKFSDLPHQMPPKGILTNPKAMLAAMHNANYR